MCGIVASVSADGGVRGELIHAAVRQLRHRGPDAQHVWVAPDGRAGLGHARLSIIDLATGDQPIASEDEQLHIIVNGELYDFERIRAALIANGHHFRTGSDSEIALHLYEDLGVGCVERLRGEYAFAIWDSRRQQIFAARDRFGIKPLYYAIHDGKLHLASEVKALAALGVPLRWDRESLYDIHYVAHPPERTLFAGVYQLPPAHYLIGDGRRVHVAPYWDWNFPPTAETAATGDPAEWVGRVRSELEDAIRLRLRADVPVACYLSGGIDSCAVLGMASRQSARPLRAFTLSFDHVDYDERATAEAQAAHAGAEFQPIDIRADALAESFSDAIYHAERPFANAHGIAKFLLSRAVRDAGIKVVLTGEGSDEVFAGYPHFVRDRLLYGAHGLSLAERSRALAALERAHRVSRGTLLPHGSTRVDEVRRRLGFVPSSLDAWAQAGAGMLRFATAAFTDAFASRDTLAALVAGLDVDGQLTGRDPLNQSLYIWAKTMLPNYILSNLGDRMEMAHSVEGRLPFLDHHLVELVARMPVALKINGTTEKYVLREAARHVLIEPVYARRKHPFLAPPATLQRRAPLYTLMQDTLRSRTLDGPGIYDRKKVLRLLNVMPVLPRGMRTRADALLMWMTSICLLHERLRLAA